MCKSILAKLSTTYRLYLPMYFSKVHICCLRCGCAVTSHSAWNKQRVPKRNEIHSHAAQDGTMPTHSVSAISLNLCPPSPPPHTLRLPFFCSFSLLTPGHSSLTWRWFGQPSFTYTACLYLSCLVLNPINTGLTRSGRKGIKYLMCFLVNLTYRWWRNYRT